MTLNRKFVEYVIKNDVAADFLRWVNKTDVPDEMYFAILIHNPQLDIPGSFKGRYSKIFIWSLFLYNFFQVSKHNGK